ncbi:PREDICTED: bridging integrator 3 homolog [Ceratosolen solmsi marchali]|uniref:Bridging integrator 3 homolog n=1 Tax=Ceratosolen solmsi marchali TaxID=326594 RepID=A0AAJ6YDH7_9HYME|nr:PREDICTED: bridging integrator 3 homolog [Ceratosolen solmsi marchali]
MWNSLRKQWIERPTPAQPCLTISEDSELDMTVRIVKSVERCIKQLEKDIKKYIESIEQLDTADQTLTKNLTSYSLVHANDDFKKLVADYHVATAETCLRSLLNVIIIFLTKAGKTVQEVVEGYTKTFTEPITALYDSFSRIKASLNKREDLVSIWKKAHANLIKYEAKPDKTAEQCAKLEKQRRVEEEAANELKIFHASLLDELQMFVKERQEYLEPCVNAFLTIQLIYYTQTTEQLNKLISVADGTESMEQFSKLKPVASGLESMEQFNKLLPVSSGLESMEQFNKLISVADSGESMEQFNKLISVADNLESPTSLANSMKEYEQRINDQLDRIKSLAIVKK